MHESEDATKALLDRFPDLVSGRGRRAGGAEEDDEEREEKEEGGLVVGCRKARREKVSDIQH